MNIGRTLESLNSLISKKQRKRISRHTKFMKQQKRTLKKTLKQDKMYRQQLHNCQEDMFNSTITRLNNKTKKKAKFLDAQDNTMIGGDESFQSIPESSSVREATNVTIIISKVVIDSSSEPGQDGKLLESVENYTECPNASTESNMKGKGGNEC